MAKAPAYLRDMASVPKTGIWINLWFGVDWHAVPVAARWLEDRTDQGFRSRGWYRMSPGYGLVELPDAAIGWAPLEITPELLEAAALGLEAMEADLALTIEHHCLLNTDLTPRRETLDGDVRGHVEKLEAKIARARAAITRAEAPADQTGVVA